MSITIPISKIRTYEHGDELASVSGMLENVWERKTGTGKKGPWSIQNLMLKDATGSIKVTLFGRKECPKSMEGKQVELLNCLVDDNTYNGKTTRTVKVTEDSNVKTLDIGPQASPPTPAASNSGGKMVHGATVGMAINNAVHILLAVKQAATSDYFADDEFIYDLHAVASSIIHVSSALEAGQKLEEPNAAPPIHRPLQSDPSGPPPDDSNFLQEGEEAF